MSKWSSTAIEVCEYYYLSAPNGEKNKKMESILPWNQFCHVLGSCWDENKSKPELRIMQINFSDFTAKICHDGKIWYILIFLLHNFLGQEAG